MVCMLCMCKTMPRLQRLLSYAGKVLGKQQVRKMFKHQVVNMLLPKSSIAADILYKS
jgi:hypothetical protein